MASKIIALAITARQLHDYINDRHARSAWDKGVNDYAHELVSELEARENSEGRAPADAAETQTWMLDGARDWSEYSWGGCSLVYDAAIVERLCTPGERRRYEAGKLRNVQWLDVQARALYQAACIVTDAVKEFYAEAAASAEYIKASGEARKHA